MKNHRLVSSLALLASLASTAAYAGNIEVFDVRSLAGVTASSDQSAINASYDSILAGAVVAGIANRNQGQVFVRQYQVDDGILDLLVHQPTPWQNASTETLDAMGLIQRHRGLLRGLVVWDPKVPATVNVAISVAGAESAVPVRYDPSPNSLYRSLVGKGFATLVSFVDAKGASIFTGKGTIPGTSAASTGSAKCDAYRWELEKYVKAGRVGKSGFAALPDAYLWFSAGARSNRAIGYMDPSNVARMAELSGLVVDLLPTTALTPVDDPKQKPGTDRSTLVALLNAAHANRAKGSLMQAYGFVPWEKYTGDEATAVTKLEWPMQALQSSFDIYGGSVANASFMGKDAFTPTYKQAKPSQADLQKRGYVDKNGRVKSGVRFIGLYGGDYDGSYLSKNLFPHWSDPRRGEVPVTWAINPQLSLDAPRIYDYIRRNASANDFFIMADSGAGYVNPRNFQAPRPDSGSGDNLQGWLNWNSQWVIRSECDICWIIDGSAGMMNGAGLQAYAGCFPHGLLTQLPYSKPNIGDVPVIQLVDYSSKLDAGLVAAPSKTISEFDALRMIVWTPTQFANFASSLKSKQKAVEFVDIYTLMLLRKLANQNGFVH